MTTDKTSNRVEYFSANDFDNTMKRVVDVIETAGMTIFARIDHAAAARGAGLQMPPTVLLLFGNPNGGTPIMLAAPAAALELPLRVLLRENADGNAILSFHPIRRELEEAGVPEALAARLEPVQRVVLKALEP